MLGFLGTAIHLPSAWLTSPKVLAVAVVSGFASYFLGLVISIAISRGWNDARNTANSSAGGTAAQGARVGSMKAEERARWSQDVPVSSDNAVRAGQQFALASGRVEMLTARGTRVVLEGPATWKVVSDQRLLLLVGKLVAYVPKSAIGFAVETPTARVVDLGTEFGVEVDSQGETGVQVFKGTVDFASAGRAKPQHGQAGTGGRQLQAGQAARTDARANAIVDTPFNPDKFSRSGLRPAKSAQDRVLIDLKGAAATQSTAPNQYHSANAACDADPKTMSHTSVDDAASWWQVDLGRERPIAAVVLQNDLSKRGWLRDITVKILADDGKTVVVASHRLNPKNLFGGGEKDFDAGVWQLTFNVAHDAGKPVIGRFVRVEREHCDFKDEEIVTADRRPDFLTGCRNALVLGEVEVYGPAEGD